MKTALVQILGISKEVTSDWVVLGVSDAIRVDRWGQSRSLGGQGAMSPSVAPDAHVPPRHLSVSGHDDGSAGRGGNRGRTFCDPTLTAAHDIHRTPSPPSSMTLSPDQMASTPATHVLRHTAVNPCVFASYGVRGLTFLVLLFIFIFLH